MVKRKILRKRFLMAFMVCVVLFTAVFAFSTTPNTQDVHGLTFHGIYVGDRDSIEMYYLYLTIPRTQFGIRTGAVNNTAPYSGSRSNRRERYLTVILHFPNITLNGHQNPYLMANLWIDVPTGWQRWNEVTPRYYILPTTLRLSLSNNFFVHLRHNGVPDSAFSKFNMTIFYNLRGYEAVTVIRRGISATSPVRQAFNVPARTEARQEYIGIIDPSSPYFDVNAGNSGNVGGNPPNNTPTRDPSGCASLGSFMGVPIAVLLIILAGVVVIVLLLQKRTN